MTFRKIASLAILLVIPAASIAQQNCVEMAKVIAFNQSKSYSYDQQASVNKASLCSESYSKRSSARSAQIEASYKFFSGSAAGSESQITEMQNKMCEGHIGEYWSLSIKDDSARTASTESLKVLDTCLRMNSRGLNPDLIVSPEGKTVTLNLSWIPSNPSSLNLVQVGPANFNDFQCSATAPSLTGTILKQIKNTSDIAQTLKSPGYFTLACERPSNQKLTDGESFACYREMTIILNTSGGAETFNIPQYCTPSMPGKRAATIEQKLATLIAQQKIDESIVTTMQDKITATNNMQYSRFINYSAMLNVPTSSLNSSCVNGGLQCLSAVRRYCVSQNFEGGIPQEWNNEVHIVLCLGKKS